MSKWEASTYPLLKGITTFNAETKFSLRRKLYNPFHIKKQGQPLWVSSIMEGWCWQQIPEPQEDQLSLRRTAKKSITLPPTFTVVVLEQLLIPNLLICLCLQTLSFKDSIAEGRPELAHLLPRCRNFCTDTKVTWVLI